MSHRDDTFEAWYQGLPDKAGIGGREIMRQAWDAGRRYESERVARVTQPRQSHNEACDGCGSPADYARMRARMDGTQGEEDAMRLSSECGHARCQEPRYGDPLAQLCLDWQEETHA